MLRKISTYFIFTIFQEINCQVIPSQRYLHTATLIDNNLYIIGGQYLTDTFIGKEFICLNISSSFNTWELLWQNLTDINKVPPHIGAASAQSGANMFLYGGISTNNEEKYLIYRFDTRSNEWITLNTFGEKNKAFLTSIIDSNEKMYLFGGKHNLNNDILNDMLIFDTKNLSLISGSLVNAPSIRSDYGAVLLPNQNIIYLGN
jgi:N-acetylneuraminic acid mutarotase